MVRQRGFSLIELLIVVAIILIIAAIAIPNFIRARIAANEASAVNSLRSITTAETTYFANFPTIGYTDLSSLGGTQPCSVTSTTACLIAEDLMSGTKSGYLFTASPDTSTKPNPSYSSTANPIAPTTGTRHFYSDNTGTIRFNATATATSADAAL